ncbi:MAG TPA: Rieske 2Fe-2S domain-containing protein [Candidatus Nitrosopolaris sp.]|nr:Rieske 2Fe-2S domain-containing protein [Candidatus Nitrosopolaris sp.]
MAKNEFVEVANVNEIPVGKMKHVEVDGKEILVANIGGNIYAMDDRCGHMNALLSMGNLTGNTLACPFHGSKFDAITGKKLTEPVLTPSSVAEGMEPLPQTWQKFFENVGQLMAPIKTYDQRTYETTMEGDRIKIKI